MAAMRPPEAMTISQWADRNRILTKEYSNLPGPWRTDRVPYLREPMDAFKSRRVEHLSFCFGTQLGKTEMLINMFGYAVDQDPGPVILAYPTDILGKDVAKGRLRSAIDNCSALASKFDVERSEIQRLFFTGVEVAVIGGNSPSQLASRPARYIFYDETDKFPLRAGDDANPFLLAGERTKTFHNKKEVEASSPTVENGRIWQSLMRADAVYRPFLPCPHCGAYQDLRLRQIKWPEELNAPEMKDVRIERVLQEAWYECEVCRKRIYDIDKQQMLSRVRWRPSEWVTSSRRWVERKGIVPGLPRRIGYSASSLYSPWIRFGEVARKFLTTRDKPEEFMGFVNGWLAEPWVNQTATFKSDIVLSRQASHERGAVPEGALMLVMGIDVQIDCFWWIVRAWGERMTSWLVDYGRCETWAELDDVVDREFRTVRMEPMQIFFGLIDSGDRTDEVYEYCSTRPGLILPCKGSSNRMLRGPISESQVEKSGFGDLRLLMVDTHYYKNFISGRLSRPASEPGAFMVFHEERAAEGGWLRAYAEQLCAEHLVEEVDKKGRKKEVWQPVTTNAPNHLLDCEVYGVAAAERAGVRFLRGEE